MTISQIHPQTTASDDTGHVSSAVSRMLKSSAVRQPAMAMNAFIDLAIETGDHDMIAHSLSVLLGVISVHVDETTIQRCIVRYDNPLVVSALQLALEVKAAR